MLILQRLWKATSLAWMTAEAWLALVIFDLAIVAGFTHVHRYIKRYRPKNRRTRAIADVIWAVEEACVWYVKRAACLQRSVVATWLLRRNGIPAELIIGFRPVPFESHAWVEVDGMVANDLPQYKKVFSVLDRL